MPENEPELIGDILPEVLVSLINTPKLVHQFHAVQTEMERRASEIKEQCPGMAEEHKKNELHQEYMRRLRELVGKMPEP